jgi:hypothetical protein
MSALTGSTATAVAHWSESTRRSPAGFMPLMVHDVVGVRRRLPVMIMAGANTLIGFLNAMPFPARAKVSSQEPSWTQAPSSLGSAALAGDIAPDARTKASKAARALPTELMRLPSPNLNRTASAITEPSRPRRLI